MDEIIREGLAGLIVGILAVPQGLSFASVAGLPPVYGLYNSIFASLPYFFLGTCPFLVVGPTAVLSLLTRTAIPHTLANGQLVVEGSPEWIQFASTLALLSGMIQICFGSSGLGIFVRLISEPVLHGMISASAILMVLGQTNVLLGIPKCNAADLHGPEAEFDECMLSEYAYSLYLNVESTHKATFICSLLTLGFLYVYRHVMEKFRLPRWSRLGPILLACGVLLFFSLSAHFHGTGFNEEGKMIDSKTGISLIGKIPTNFPHPKSPFSLLSFKDVRKLLFSALLCSLLGFMETIAIETSLKRQDSSHKLSYNWEFIAVGASNMFCSVFGGYPVSGSVSRTTVNVENGASRHQVSSLISSLVVLSVLVLFSSQMQYMPDFALGCIVLTSVIGLLRPWDILFLFRTSSLDCLSYVLVLGLTCFYGFEIGLSCGVIINWSGTLLITTTPTLSLFRLLAKGEFVDACDDIVGSDSSPDVALLALKTNLQFRNSALVETAVDAILEMFHPQALIIDFSQCETMDSSGVHILQVIATTCANRLQSFPCLLAVGVRGETRRMVERANLSKPELHWNLAPVVGGMGSTWPRLLCFESIPSALEFIRFRTVKPSDAMGVQQTHITYEGLALMREARISSWRQESSEMDVTPGCRIPTFAREVPFQVITVAH